MCLISSSQNDPEEHGVSHSQIRSKWGPIRIKPEEISSTHLSATTLARKMVHDIAKVGFGEGTNELYDR